MFETDYLTNDTKVSGNFSTGFFMALHGRIVVNIVGVAPRVCELRPKMFTHFCSISTLQFTVGVT
jgi:hypothetical protein